MRIFIIYLNGIFPAIRSLSRSGERETAVCDPKAAKGFGPKAPGRGLGVAGPHGTQVESRFGCPSAICQSLPGKASEKLRIARRHAALRN